MTAQRVKESAAPWCKPGHLSSMLRSPVPYSQTGMSKKLKQGRVKHLWIPERKIPNPFPIADLSKMLLNEYRINEPNAYRGKNILLLMAVSVRVLKYCPLKCISTPLPQHHAQYLSCLLLPHFCNNLWCHVISKDLHLMYVWLVLREPKSNLPGHTAMKWQKRARTHTPNSDAPLHSPVARHLLASPVCVARIR